MPPTIDDKITTALRNRLVLIPGLVAAYAHGSVPAGTARADSDLDVALLFRHDFPIDGPKLLGISGELEAILGRPVHLGLLNRDNLVFTKEALGNGVRIFCSDQTYCDTFAMLSLSMYAELNELRQPVLAAYAGLDAS